MNAVTTIGQSGAVGLKMPNVAGYRPGIEVRQAIIRELARREAAGLAPPSLREWPDALPKPRGGKPLHWTTVQTHLEILRTAGLIEGTGEAVRLTDCGRGALAVVQSQLFLTLN